LVDLFEIRRATRAGIAVDARGDVVVTGSSMRDALRLGAWALTRCSSTPERIPCAMPLACQRQEEATVR
jgi:hypothetical protein